MTHVNALGRTKMAPASPADDVLVLDELAGDRAAAAQPRGFYQLRFEAAATP